jgi:hypothetical protein
VGQGKGRLRGCPEEGATAIPGLLAELKDGSPLQRKRTIELLDEVGPRSWWHSATFAEVRSALQATGKEADLRQAAEQALQRAQVARKAKQQIPADLP